MRNITESPEYWVIIKIQGKKDYYKVFGTWSGGYLGRDRFRLNSGISSIEEDDENYYFTGLSGSCYSCPKEGYGFANSYGRGVLEDLIKKSPIKVEVLDPETDFTNLLRN
jgi:hypothetical protein